MVVTIIQENLQTINVLQVNFTNHSTKCPTQSNLKKRGREDSKAIIVNPKTFTVVGTTNTISHFSPHLILSKCKLSEQRI